MAEFCLDCVNKYVMDDKEVLKEKDVILSIDWCEGCEAWKPCVVVIKPETFRELVKRIYNRAEYRFKCVVHNKKR